MIYDKRDFVLYDIIQCTILPMLRYSPGNGHKIRPNLI